ncbi:MAG: GYD domain-containing protein [Aestuariivirga sp.]
MARYILLLNWTDQGIKNVRESVKRLDAARELARKLKCEIRDFYMTMGAYDLVVIAEAPDDETMAKFNLTLAMGGNVRTTTLTAFSEDAYRRIIGGL